MSAHETAEFKVWEQQKTQRGWVETYFPTRQNTTAEIEWVHSVSKGEDLSSRASQSWFSKRSVSVCGGVGTLRGDGCQRSEVEEKLPWKMASRSHAALQNPNRYPMTVWLRGHLPFSSHFEQKWQWRFFFKTWRVWWQKITIIKSQYASVIALILSPSQWVLQTLIWHQNR